MYMLLWEQALYLQKPSEPEKSHTLLNVLHSIAMTDLTDRLLFISLQFYLTIGVFFCMFFYALHAYMKPVEPWSNHKMHHTGVRQKSYLVLCVERISLCFFSWTASALYPWVISPAQRFTFLLQFHDRAWIEPWVLFLEKWRKNHKW